MGFKKSIASLYFPLLILVCSFLFSPFQTQACTVFNKSIGDNVLFGNVENNWPGSVTELHFNPPGKALNSNGNFLLMVNDVVAGGMNDKGLCFDVK